MFIVAAAHLCGSRKLNFAPKRFPLKTRTSEKRRTETIEESEQQQANKNQRGFARRGACA
jgi:hypothetical protein